MHEVVGIAMIILAFSMLGFLGYILSNPPKESK